MRLSKSFVRDSLRSWRAPSLRCVGVYSASRPPPSLLATPLNLKFDADWNAADHKKLLTAHATAPLPEETLSGPAPLRDVSERLAQEECVLRTAVGEVRVEVNRYSAWLDGAEFVLAQYRLASRPTVEEKGNLSFVLGGEVFRVTCPLFYKLPHAQECVAEALHRRGLGVRAEQVVVTVGDHTMEAEESLQQLDVGAGSVLKVALKGATLVRGTERACEVVLRNTEDVRAFLAQVQASRLYSAQQLTVRIGDAEGCESYTPLATVLALLGDMALPRLETLTVVLGVLGVEEDWASCFATACFPALKELRVYQHEAVKKEQAEEVVKKEKTKKRKVEEVKKEKVEEVVKKEELKKVTEVVRMEEVVKKEAAGVNEAVVNPISTDVAREASVEDDVSPVMSDAESVLTEEKDAEMGKKDRVLVEVIQPENVVEEVKPVMVEPAKTTPVKEEPVKEEPMKAQPVKEEPMKAQPVKEEPMKAQPVKEEPMKERPEKEAQPEKVQSAEAEARKAFSQTINGVAFSFAVSRPDKSQCVVTIEARAGEYAVFFEPGADDLQFTIEHKQKQYKTSVPRDATLKELARRAVKVCTTSRSEA